MKLNCASRTHVGLRRKLNEDAVLAEPSRGLFVVADGMGGHEAGEVASNLVVQALGEVDDADGVEPMVAALTRTLHEVNRQLRAMAAGGPERRTIGTTVVALAIHSGRFGCLWSGDSRAYRVRDGQLAQLTRDHSLVQELVDAGMLAAADAPHHPSAHVITRAVGADDVLDVDAVTGDTRRGDRFLLASDGLTRHVDDPELEAWLGSGQAEPAADRLIDTVLARGAADNVSLVIVDVS